MIFFRRVVGQSMVPTIYEGTFIVAISAKKYAVGDIVVAHVGDREVIKRIGRLRDDSVWLVGDNAAQSTDSRDYGWIDKSAILGRMKYMIPVAKPAPKLRHPYGAYVGMASALIMIIFALIHLFRIDTFVPELAQALGGEQSLTLSVSAAIICAEVFSIPFLLRMKLSPLAQYVSGALGVVVPLFWLLIAIWTYGTTLSTAQLGEFKSLPGSWPLIILNGLWLIYAYVALWMLGYDRRPGEKQPFIGKFLSSRLSKSK